MQYNPLGITASGDRGTRLPGPAANTTSERLNLPGAYELRIADERAGKDIAKLPVRSLTA